MRCWIGSTSSITGDCSRQSTTYRPPNMNRCIIASRRSQPWRLDAIERVSETPGVNHNPKREHATPMYVEPSPKYRQNLIFGTRRLFFK
jgi:hypothetical protein